MSVYRRGAVYWWHRQVPLGELSPHPIKLRMSLKTSEKAEARARAHALDTELEMVALAYPKRNPGTTREQLETVFREALEYKRDQIADRQSRPPFDIEEHQLINAAMARIYGLLARTGSLDVSAAQWERACSDPVMSDRELTTFLGFAREYRFQSPTAELPSQGGHVTQQYPVAPRFVMTALNNAGLADTADNRRVVLSVMASAYQQALLQANDRLAGGGVAQLWPYLPKGMIDQLTSPAPLSDEPNSHSNSVGRNQQSHVQPVMEEPSMSAPSPGIGLIDLRMSELTKFAIETHTTSGAWQDSAQRNAKTIADIFIAENGDLRMSEIETKHVLAVRRRLETMPTIWGKSSEDRRGGLAFVFARGEALKEKRDGAKTEDEKKGLAKIGFSATTINRHILTLRQQFDFLRERVDGDGNKTHVAPRASFSNLTIRDRRKKNRRKPVPAPHEMHRLLSSPLHTGCAGPGVLQRSNIHIATCAPGTVGEKLTALRESPKTASQKARFVLATDGVEFQAEDVTSGETIACDAYADFPDHFGFFLPLAGITTVEQIRESSFDIRATGRLNKLYVTLLQDNPEWAAVERRTDMNHFMARLIFCFFAEDTDIFHPSYRFTATVERMSAGGADNTAEVIAELFRAMNTPIAKRQEAGIARWADGFPYVNGNLFVGVHANAMAVPRFSRIARSYLIHIGNLDWTKINPDIFGSMIQAVADDEERGALGMHYTSVPNILKVLNPLFLDDLRAKLEEAGDNSRKLLNLRNRIAKIRVFDPACGSGNFLVIAYKEMRAIEAEINQRRGEPDRKTEIPLTNFRGIELRDFPAEIARLALIIAEYQCDVLYRGQKEALAEFLPLNNKNWITCGNALRLDWLSICEPQGKSGGRIFADDLYGAPLDQAKVDFANEGGETYLCGNPPYLGSTWQTKEQKADLENLLSDRIKSWKSLDYVAGWFVKAADYNKCVGATAAFVATNSVCQGQQVPILWPLIFATGNYIPFAHTSFKWRNLASHNAGVTVVVVGMSTLPSLVRRLFSEGENGEPIELKAENINAYLIPGKDIMVEGLSRPLGPQSKMYWGNKPTDGGGLLLSANERRTLINQHPESREFIYTFLGSQEMLQGDRRYCLWIEDKDREEAEKVPEIKRRTESVAAFRAASKAAETRPAAQFPHRFRQIQAVADRYTIAVPAVSSENRAYFTVGLTDKNTIHSNRNFTIYDAPLWNFALASSLMHQVWLGTVCARFETRYSYSNTIGWNALPVPKLTEQNKADLTRCAEIILLAREAHFPATIADLYDPEAMPEDLRRAHEENDEVLERIYIGRRFRNDTERLEKLFELYTKMTGKKAA